MTEEYGWTLGEWAQHHARAEADRAHEAEVAADPDEPCLLCGTRRADHAEGCR